MAVPRSLPALPGEDQRATAGQPLFVWWVGGLLMPPTSTASASVRESSVSRTEGCVRVDATDKDIPLERCPSQRCGNTFIVMFDTECCPYCGGDV